MENIDKTYHTPINSILLTNSNYCVEARYLLIASWIRECQRALPYYPTSIFSLSTRALIPLIHLEYTLNQSTKYKEKKANYKYVLVWSRYIYNSRWDSFNFLMETVLTRSFRRRRSCNSEQGALRGPESFGSPSLFCSKIRESCPLGNYLTLRV